MSDINSASAIELYHEIYGQGDPLLCIHGFGASLYSWRNFVEPLSQDYRLILIDLKGSGKSPKPEDSHYSPLDHGELLYQFIMKEDLRNLTLIGHSYGGALSLLLAIMLTERGEAFRLKSMILIDAGAYKEYIPLFVRLLSVPVINRLLIYLTPAKFKAKLVLKMSYYDPKKITKDQIDNYAAPLAAPGAKHALLETGKQIVPPNFDELVVKYKDIKVPTLIIWGKQDGLLPLKVGELLDEDIPNSTLKIIDQCGHVPQEEQRDVTVPLVLDFLKQIYP